MLRRNFIKKILFTGLGVAVFKVKLFANEMLAPFNLKDGIFINNFIDHRKSFKEFWKWRKESKRPEPITFPLAQNDPSYLKNNTSDPRWSSLPAPLHICRHLTPLP